MLKNIGLFCKKALQKRPLFCKETCIFKHPTHRSHPISFSLSSYVLSSCFCSWYHLFTLLFVRVCVFVRGYSEGISFFFPLSKDLLWVTSCVLPILPIMRVDTSRVPPPPPLPFFSPTLNRIPTPPHTLLAKCHSWGWKKKGQKTYLNTTHTQTLWLVTP